MKMNSNQMTETTYEHLSIHPYQLTIIDQVIMKQEINQHATLVISGVVSSEVRNKYLDETDFGTEIQLIQNKNNKENILFKGIISYLEMQVEGQLYKMTIHAVSYTMLMDIKIKKRSFQNIHQTYESLAKNITAEYGTKDIIFTADVTKTTGDFVIQYLETDWQFLVRMASHFNQGLYPYIKGNGVQYFFGPPHPHSAMVMDDHSYRVKKRMGEFKVTESNDIPDSTELDFVYFEVESALQLDLGQQVIFRNVPFYIKSVTRIMERGILCNHYILSSRNGLKQRRFENQALQGTSVCGQVLDVKRDQVKVHIDEMDQSQPIDTACWFPYSTLYASKDGSGWYCMPEIGDRVRVQFPDLFDKHAYVVSSISTYKPTEDESDRMKDYQVRYLRNPQGMEITLSPDQVIISANGKSVIVLDQSGEISVQANQKLVLSADQDIQIRAGNSIEFTASKQIHIACGNKAEINLNQSGSTQIKGNTVYTN